MTGPIANPLPKLRVAILLPGLGRVQRGAETAFLELARSMNAYPDVSLRLFGSGPETPADVPITNVGCTPRERFEGWPKMPVLRSDYAYEEMSFILRLISRRAFKGRDYDVAVHCTFPFTNWFLQRTRGAKPIFVTQNGDWMCRAQSREYRTFKCAGLVCTNPEYYERHQEKYRSALIPNGVDPELFRPRRFVKAPRDPRLPANKKIVLMVSALIASKRVAEGIRAVASVSDAFLLLAGDGPDRQAIQELAERELPGRHLLLGSIPRETMPDLYRQADAFLHMSQDEPFGIVYLEAAASELPIVAHDAAIPRWILGDSAYFADTGDAAAVRQALKWALSAEASAKGRAARLRIMKDWTWAAQALKYRDFLYSCSGSPRPAEAV